MPEEPIFFNKWLLIHLRFETFGAHYSLWQIIAKLFHNKIT